MNQDRRLAMVVLILNPSHTHGQIGPMMPQFPDRKRSLESMNSFLKPRYPSGPGPRIYDLTDLFRAGDIDSIMKFISELGFWFPREGIEKIADYMTGKANEVMMIQGFRTSFGA